MDGRTGLGGLRIRDVHKSFPNGTEVLKGINIDVNEGEFLILVGSSGCGKSTLLNMVAGLDTVTRGDIFIGGQRVNDLPPRSRDIAMVFQSYALYPSMTVRENISFGLEVRRVPAAERAQTVRRVAETLQIGHLLDRKPRALSGGQRQRVAMGRALARNPTLFLFDEPLSNLDAQLRLELRTEMRMLHQRLGKTTCYVTHDQIEAMTLGDRIAVMRDGVVLQVGSPNQIYSDPINRYVAGFIGSPPMNFIPVQVAAMGSGVAVAVNGGAGQAIMPLPSLPTSSIGRELLLGLRPEQITETGAEGGIALDVDVTLVELTGPDALVLTEINGQRCLARVHPRAAPRAGGTTRLRLDAGAVLLFDLATGDRVR